MTVKGIRMLGLFVMIILRNHLNFQGGKKIKKKVMINRPADSRGQKTSTSTTTVVKSEFSLT